MHHWTSVTGINGILYQTLDALRRTGYSIRCRNSFGLQMSFVSNRRQYRTVQLYLRRVNCPTFRENHQIISILKQLNRWCTASDSVWTCRSTNAASLQTIHQREQRQTVNTPLLISHALTSPHESDSVGRAAESERLCASTQTVVLYHWCMNINDNITWSFV